MYEVIRPVYVDDMLHYPGEQLNISEAQAEHLGAAVKEVVVKAEAPAKAPKPAKQ